MTRARRHLLSVVTLLGCALLLILAAPGAAPTSQPSPVQYHEEVRANPPLHLHLLTVDLTDPRVSVRVVRGGEDPDAGGPWQTKLDTVRNIANREHLEAAVNGHFFGSKEAVDILGKKDPYFTGNWAVAVGWAMSDGVLWSKQPAGATMVVDAKGGVSIGRFGKLPADARQAVSSGELLLVHGRNVAGTNDLAPRTAIGIDRSGRKLIMLVVDGRRADFSVGMTGPQVADELAKLGCFDALMLDGGGSSTMVMRDAGDQTIHVLNHPSDGHDLPMDLSVERPVADAVGIVVKGASSPPATQK
jgi:uncharacterized protein YigE (DUF2233 family)